VRSHSHSVVVVAVAQREQLLSSIQRRRTHLNLHPVSVAHIRRRALVHFVHEESHPRRRRDVGRHIRGDHESWTQIRHYQRLVGNQLAGLWAQQQLRSELEVFSRHIRGGR